LKPEEVRDFIDFATKRLPIDRDTVAPDGADVRVLLGLRGGGMAHFVLGPGKTSAAVRHGTVDEIWYFLSGRGEMWRRNDSREEVVPVGPKVCVTIPVGTLFQFRSFGAEPLTAVAVTMPPWPGEGEAVGAEGKWAPTVPR
jgi:mannose-6-phosphate isomerase-like protein (cupin superfamily)